MAKREFVDCKKKQFSFLTFQFWLQNLPVSLAEHDALSQAMDEDFVDEVMATGPPVAGPAIGSGSGEERALGLSTTYKPPIDQL